MALASALAMVTGGVLKNFLSRAITTPLTLTTTCSVARRITVAILPWCLAAKSYPRLVVLPALGARSSSSSSVSFFSGWEFGVEHLVDHLDLLLEAAGDKPPDQADPVSSFSDGSRRLVCRSLAFS